MNDELFVRNMLRRHIASPDPVAWLAAADHFEEKGDAESARKWRRRGEWYPILHPIAKLLMKPGTPRGSGDRAIVGPFEVRFSRKTSSMLVEAFRVSSTAHERQAKSLYWAHDGEGAMTPVHGSSQWRVHVSENRDVYLNGRVIDLIDWLADTEHVVRWGLIEYT